MRLSTLRIALSGLVLTGSAGLALPVAAQSVIYCCDDASNKKVCGDFLPKECQRRAYEERDGRGFVIKKVEAPLTPEQQARRDAEIKRKAELEQQRIEERRRDMALLSTYADERDVDAARDRALADIDKLVKQAEKVLADSTARRAKVEQEKEFYKSKTLPQQLKDQLALADKDVTVKRAAVNERLAERQAVTDKFAQEKRKFVLLKCGKAAAEEEAAKPKREVVVQANEGAASEVRNASPAGEAGAAPAAPAAPAPATRPEDEK